MNAFVNGELGTVKYVGRVEFAEGIWVGVHLKNQSKNLICISQLYLSRECQCKNLYISVISQ